MRNPSDDSHNYWLMPMKDNADENEDRSTISSLTWNTYSFSSWSSFQTTSGGKKKRILIGAIVLFCLITTIVIVLLMTLRSVRVTDTAPAQPTLTVGSWNVLCSDDEWNTSWGPPLQISLCANNKTECTKQRRQREWVVLESAFDIDAIALQEAEDGFFELQNEDSIWEIAARSDQCAILFRKGGEWNVEEAFHLTIPDMTGCEFAPTVALKREGGDKTIMFSSVHVQASVEDMDEWYASAAEIINAAGTDTEQAISIIGGDFNHNVSSVSKLPDDWGISEPLTMLSDGTSQHQDGWMGSFDQIFHSSKSDYKVTTRALVKGFMPKNVEGFEQGGKTVERSKFKSMKDNTELWFDESEEFEGGEKIVTMSSPVSEAMSDHVLVVSVIYI
ncbi:hypothetical protein TrLO_g1509 [Triparma laevis f. longispina]|uniref:Endonuclease/exonuclease/phosphatase domain-containing protein n=1 Tax=Triparma laevis f. longispina TaxID=1714387 RepID=A0A9W7A1C4_9STRA|nr:hypothetical protein TrLO_g1509 [Triparma laevis f. longispina]